MKKLTTFIVLLLSALVLFGCTPTTEVEKTPPTFVGLSIDETNPHNGSELVVFYKQRSEEFLVEVTLDNPDNLEIRAIVIDGYYYRPHMFTADSTNTVVKFYMEAGDVIGEHEFSVDDIEYAVGADSFTSLVNKNNLFRVYVFEDIPSVYRNDYKDNTDSLIIGMTVTDNDNVIVEDTLIATLYAGQEVIEVIPLTVGYQQFTFSNLDSNKLYEVRVTASYEVGNTEGLQENVELSKYSYTTGQNKEPSGNIFDLETSSDSVVFSVDITDTDLTIIPGTLKLVLMNPGSPDVVYTITGDVAEFEIDGLLNDNDYSISLMTQYDLRDGLLSQPKELDTINFRTDVQSIPVPVLDNMKIEENRILFDVVIDDPFGIILEDTLIANLYKDGELISSNIVNDYNVEFQVFNILAGDDFIIEIVSSYDLNDGDGVVENAVILTEELTTKFNAAPSVNVSRVLVEQGHLYMELSVLDDNETLKGNLIASLYEDGVLVGSVVLSTDTTEVVFEHPFTFESRYRVDITADYNLRDGAGTVFEELLYRNLLAAFEPLPPAAEFKNASVDKEGFTFEVIILDADLTIEPGSVYVLIEKTGMTPIILPMEDLGSKTFTVEDLLSNNAYTISVIADYDVLDNSGVQEDQVLLTTTLQTSSKVLPTTTISNPVLTDESIVIDIEIIDGDNVTVFGTIYAQLYRGTEAVGTPKLLSVGANNGIIFDEEILSNNSYDIKVYTDYNLNEGNDDKLNVFLGAFTVSTEEKTPPTASLDNIVSEKEEISFSVDITDVDGVIVGNTKAVLYIGDTPFQKNGSDYEIPLNVGLNSDVEFTGVYSNQNYNIRIITDYDLNDGQDAYENQLLVYDFAQTYQNQIPTGDITTVTVGIDTITIGAVIVDEDSVITNNLVAALYVGEDLFVDEFNNPAIIPLVEGENVNKVFTNLISDTQYQVRILTDFNLRDSEQEQTGLLLDSYTTNTDAYTQPTAVITSFVKGIDFVEFDVTVSDKDNTSTPTGYYVELYQGNNPIPNTQITLHEGLNQKIEYTGLDSGQVYEYRVFAYFDLVDGLNERLGEIYSREESTIAKKVPVGDASNVVFDDNGIRFKFDYLDEDGTLKPNSLVAELYIPGVELPIASNPIVSDEVVFDLTGFLSDFDFTVVVSCEFDLSDGNGYVEGVCLDLDLTTPALTVPFVVISDIVINQDNVSARLNIQDEDSVIEDNLTAFIYDDQGAVVSQLPVTLGEYDIVFDNVTLDHGKLYSIIVKADTNLKDGSGLVLNNVLRENQVMTFNKLVPQARVTNEVITVNSISFDVEILDNDTTFVANAKAILLDNGVPVLGQEKILGIGTTSVSFTGLISNHDYEVVFVIDYDTGTTNGIDYEYEMLKGAYTVLAKQVPTAEVINEVVTSSSIDFEVVLTDTDVVLEGQIFAVLYKNGVPVPGKQVEVFVGTTAGSFTGIQSNTTYDIKVIADYDLDDLSSVVEDAIIVTKTSKTSINEVPSAVITNVSVDSSTFSFDVEVTDVDGVITQDLQAELYIDGTPTGDIETITLGSVNSISFTGLNSDSIYTVNIVADYDLNDGINVVDGYIMINNTKVTTANDIPSANITYLDSSYDSITFNVNVVDLDLTTTTNLVAQLYDAGVPVAGQTVVLTPGLNVGKQFTGILSNNTYEVKILTDYDLRDGDGEVPDYEMFSANKITKAKETPEALVSNIEVTNTEITFDVEVLDVASAIQDNLEAVLLKDGVPVQTNNSIIVGTNTDVTFSGLEFGVEYTVEVRVDYNKNIGEADITGFVMSTFDSQTRELIIIDNITNLPLEVNIDLFVDDHFGVLYDGYIQIIAYDKDTLEVADTYLVNVNTPTNAATVDLLNYYNNHAYELVFKANISDGQGSFTTETVHTMSLTTERKQLQSIALGEIGVNGTEISSSVSLVLPDDEFQLITGSVYAKLYEWDGSAYIEVGSQEVFNGDNTIVFSVFDGTVGTQYLITLEATLDWNEQDLGLTSQIIEQRTFLYITQN